MENAQHEEQEQVSAGGKTPAYVAYSTFKTLLDDLNVNGLPPQIDRSVLKRFSGGVQSQLIPALKYLGLITTDSRPTRRLKALVDAYGTDLYAFELRDVLEASYPFVHAINLKTATATMFADAFKEGTGAKEDVLRKCRTFYLQAAKEAGIEMGPRLQNIKSVRAPSNGAKSAKRGARKSKDDTLPPPPPLGGAMIKSHQTILLEKFPPFDPAWPDDIKSKWFEGYERLLKISDQK